MFVEFTNVFVIVFLPEYATDSTGIICILVKYLFINLHIQFI